MAQQKKAHLSISYWSQGFVWDFFEGSEKFLIINQKNLILILRICLRNFFEVAEKFLKRLSRKKLTFPLARFSALRKDLILISRICLRFFWGLRKISQMAQQKKLTTSLRKQSLRKISQPDRQKKRSSSAGDKGDAPSFFANLRKTTWWNSFQREVDHKISPYCLILEFWQDQTRIYLAAGSQVEATLRFSTKVLSVGEDLVLGASLCFCSAMATPASTTSSGEVAKQHIKITYYFCSEG